MCNKLIKFDDVIGETTKEHNPNSSQFPDHPYRIWIIGGSGQGNSNVLLNLKNYESDIDKVCLYTEDPYEAKYQLLINKGESVGLKYFDDSKAFSKYASDMDDI